VESKRMTYEDAMSELEHITRRLTDESMPLDEMVELYEKGMSLARLCKDMLEEYEGRIEKASATMTEDTED
jgi:exodeoxyribonuclease VII small subunit